jgi:hypothetical protein
MNPPPVRLGDSLAELFLAWRRARVRAALSRTDGVRGSASEQRLVDAYDALVAAEPRKVWPS